MPPKCDYWVTCCNFPGGRCVLFSRVCWRESKPLRTEFELNGSSQSSPRRETRNLFKQPDWRTLCTSFCWVTFAGCRVALCNGSNKISGSFSELYQSQCWDDYNPFIHSSRRFDVWLLQPKNIPGDVLLVANKQKATSTNPQDLKILHDIIVYIIIYIISRNIYHDIYIYTPWYIYIHHDIYIYTMIYIYTPWYICIHTCIYIYYVDTHTH